MTFDNAFMTLYMEADGDYFEVTAICANDAQANQYLEQKIGDREGVIATDREGRVYIAKNVGIERGTRRTRKEQR